MGGTLRLCDPPTGISSVAPVWARLSHALLGQRGTFPGETRIGTLHAFLKGTGALRKFLWATPVRVGAHPQGE